MKISVVNILAVIMTLTYVHDSVGADDPNTLPPYLGGLQDFEGSQIVQIETHYDREDPPPGSPPRLSTCAKETKSRGDGACSAICINRSHKGGSCKSDICLCSD